MPQLEEEVISKRIIDESPLTQVRLTRYAEESLVLAEAACRDVLMINEPSARDPVLGFGPMLMTESILVMLEQVYLTLPVKFKHVFKIAVLPKLLQTVNVLMSK